MKKITVGLFVDAFFPMIDGVGMVVDNYAKRLLQYCNVYVISPYCGKYDDSKLPYEVIRTKSIKVPFLDYSVAVAKLDKEFKRKINKIDFDIIHIHSPFTIGKLGTQIALKKKIPLLGTMHSLYKQDFKRAVKVEWLSNILTHRIIKTFNKCNLCYAVNYSTGKVYYEEYGYKCMPKIISNATEMTYLNKLDNSIDKKYSIEKDEKVFLFVGRINKLKNIFFIVDALVELEKMNKVNYKMLFVGDGQDRKQLEEYVKQYDLSNKIIFCGKIIDREELRRYYRRADLFLFPSLYDASSIVQIEAASQKVPTLFLKDSVTSYTITNNKNGFLSAREPASYAKKIVEILSDKKLYTKVSKQAYKDLYITWDDIVTDLYNDYKSLIK